MFIVSYFLNDDPDSGDCIEFATEREARAWINARADGTQVYALETADGDLIVESAFPVLMVA